VRGFSCLAFVLVLAACGGNGDAETSLHLVVNNGPNLPVPVEVEVDIFEGTSQLVSDSITRAVPAGATTRLGDVVVYPAPGTSLLRFVVSGRKDGMTISTAVVSAAVKAGQQVEVVATLKAAPVVVPVAFCMANPDGTKCGEPTCSSNKKTLTQFACKAGACMQQDQSCAKSQCMVSPPMCR
jgi:hypothetical protein